MRLFAMCLCATGAVTYASAVTFGHQLVYLIPFMIFGIVLMYLRPRATPRGGE